MVNPYHLTVEDQVIAQLRNGPSTISLLESKLSGPNNDGPSYHTIRTVIYDMKDRNIVILDSFKHRHQVFKLNPEKDQMSTIPYLSDPTGSGRRKTYSLLQSVGQESRMKAVSSVKSLPKHVTNLFVKANTYANSKTRTPVDPELGAIREAMQADLVALESVANLYRQILAHPKFWNESTLRDMAYDKDFDKEEVLAAKNYYEAMDDSAPQFQSPLE